MVTETRCEPSIFYIASATLVRKRAGVKTSLKFVLQAGKTLLITGPASLRVENGAATVFGASLQPRQKLIVRKERQLPITMLDESILEVELGERASYLEIDGTSVPESWVAAVDAFHRLDAGRTLVVGSTDTGKSTFCTFLANSSLRNGQNVAVIDADIGQSDLGPPGSLGLSIINRPLIQLETSLVDAMIFIGEISPSSVTDKIIQGILKLEGRVPSKSLLVVNTDGWVNNAEAVNYKVRMANELRPDLVIGLAEGSELDPILEKVTTSTVKMQTPKFIKSRSRDERRSLREHGYRKYLRNSIHSNFSLEKIDAANVLEMRRRGGEMLGFLNGDGFMIGIGVLESLNRRRKMLRTYTNVLVRDVAKIECGSVRLSYDGKELEFSEKGKPLHENVRS